MPGDIPRPELVSSRMSGLSQVSSTLFGERSEEVNYRPSGSIGNSSNGSFGPDIQVQTMSPPSTGSGRFYRSSEFNMTESDGFASLQSPQKETREGRPQTIRGSSSMFDTSASQTMSREQKRSDFYSRSLTSVSHTRPASSNIMQCFRCGSRFPNTSMDDYERHITECYNDVQ